MSAAAVLPVGLAHAQAAAEWSVSGKGGLFSDDRFRGMTQTEYGPAFQGGFDIAHGSGVYLGNWNSNVEQRLYNGASLEMDFCGGCKGSAGAFGCDVGLIYDDYPDSGAAGTTKIDNTEIYVGASYDLGGAFGVNAHVGRQKVTRLAAGSIDDNPDYQLGVSNDVSGWVFGLSVIGNSEKDFAFTANSGNTVAAGKTRFVASVSRTI